MAGHSEGILQDQFCAVRTGSDQKCQCPSPNQYRKNCDPSWAGKTFIQGRKKKVDKGYEAHHLICVASVTEFIAKKKEILDIVKQTRWCVNAKKNMYAMPLWGHTIKHYCDLTLSLSNLSAGNFLKKENTLQPPPFANIPQHDYDHNSAKGYKKNHVDKAMQKIADQIQKKAEESHEAAIQDLAGVLDRLSDSFRNLLNTFGQRCGGTHAAWQKGKSEPDSDWYLPFSMAATTNAEKRIFPTGDFDAKVANKIKSLVTALGRWGG